MSDSSTRGLLELCDQLMELPADQHDAFLHQVCGDDTRMRDSINSIVRAITAAGQFLEAGFEDTRQDLVGTYIDNCKVLEKIGSGGMGSVYLAERQLEDYTQKVAVKLIHGHLLVPSLVQRFNAERKILATLNHPYIAALLDSGTTDQGIPYLVMEYIDGVPSDVYCDQDELSLPDRIRLLQKIALAVHEAHQHLVVHRDLKPSNVMVTADGIPKLLDFGIAKLLQLNEQHSVLNDKNDDTLSQHNGNRPLTELGRQAMTPNYASPEQIIEGQVTTSSDIYTLGIMAYQLIVGVQPYELDGRSQLEMLTQIEEMVVPDPISRIDAIWDEQQKSIAAQARGLSVRRYRDWLKGDIATVLLKALDRIPARRYTSVSAFSQDLGRVLNGLPVEAQPDSLPYRMRRFMQRNALPVGAALSIAAITIAALIASTTAYIRAETARAEADQRFEDVRNLANTLMFEVYDEVTRLEGSTRARQILASSAQTYLDSLAATADSPADVRYDAGRGLTRLGEVNGGIGNQSMGDHDTAADNFNRANKLLSELHEEFPDQPRYALAAAHAQNTLAEHALYTENDISKARQHAQNSIALYTPMAETSLQAKLGLADALAELADTYDWEGEPVTTAATIKQAFEVMEGIDTKPSVDLDAARVYARLLRDYGDAIYWLDRKDDSSAYLGQSVGLFREILLHALDQRKSQRQLSIALYLLAGTDSENDSIESALAAGEEAYSIAQELRAADPEDRGAISLVLSTGDQYILILSAMKMFDEAIELAYQMLALHKEASKTSTDNVHASRSLAIRTHTIGITYFQADRIIQACDWLQQAMALYEGLRMRGELSGYDEKTQLPELQETIEKSCS